MSEWTSYYQRISEACPWSDWAWKHGLTTHVPFRSFDKIIENGTILTPIKLWSIVYESVPGTVDELDDWCEQHTDEHLKYFFSHPEHSPLGNATPIPVFIQQRQDILEAARAGVFDLIINSNFVKNNNCNQAFEKWRATGNIPKTRGKQPQ